jgi:hypothetical protein
VWPDRWFFAFFANTAFEGGNIAPAGVYVERKILRWMKYNCWPGIIPSVLTSSNEAQEKEMFYHNKDIPIFHHFMFPEV